MFAVMNMSLPSWGKGRSGTLGELTVNLSGYSSSETSISIAELLKNCSYGTILQYVPSLFGMHIPVIDPSTII
ncbi:hypothetical protein Tco_0156241 [Tanacetum coccineum]